MTACYGGRASEFLLRCCCLPTDLPDRNPHDESSVTQIASRCPKGHDVVLYRINGGGHRMPGHFPDAHLPKLANGLLGPQNGDIDDTDTIWAFFSRFP